MANVQTNLNNDKLKEQSQAENCQTENAPGTKRQGSRSEIVVDMIGAESIPKDSKITWFETSFGLIGAQGSIKKQMFISAVKQIEGFADNLFNIFDSNDQDLISVQELVGGFGLLIQDKNRRNGKQLLEWFDNHFKRISADGCCISRAQFIEELKDEELVSRLFTVFDLDGNGEIQMKEFISSLDRLECSSVDNKWYSWIEDRFNVAESHNRKITFEQFKNALHLKKSFFSERFFSMFDTDGDGSIDMKELVNGLQILTKGTESEKLKFLFDVYDIDGSGSLNKGEMHVVLQSCVQESNIKFSKDQMEELVDAFFQETDADQNGQITFEEFTSCLSKFPGVAENLTIAAGNWLSPPKERAKRRLRDRTRSKMRWATLKKNGLTVFFVVLYFLINAGLFIWVAIERKDEGGWVIVARVHGMCLNFNSVFILVLMMKHSLTWLRSTKIGKYFPIDYHIDFHKAVAIVILVQAVLHFIGHLGRYIVTESGIQVWEYLFTTKAGEGWVSGTAGITGVLLFIIFGIMALMSLPCVRRGGHFELFYFTHHLFVIWWILLILHAPNFWKWFIGPAMIYIIERISSSSIVNKARHGKTFIKEGIIFPSKVTHLIIPRSQKFKYKSGDYVLVNIPHIAKYEWHPFTISSSPDQTETIWLHIRAVGTWTRKLYDYYNEQSKKKAKFSRTSRRKTISHVISEERKSARLRHRKLYSSLKEPTRNQHNERNLTMRPNNDNKRQNSFLSIPEEDERDSITLKSIKTISSSQHSTNTPDDGTGKLEIYVDGPYGAPAEHFFEAEHAVLISSGIGVTPFASILQTIMLKYKSASHMCPNCEHSWVGDIPFSLRKLQKVDFFWINRDQESFEWFISLLAQLEMEQSEQRGVFSEHFLDMHIYMTSALKKEDIKALGLQLALELIHEKKERDLITGLKTRTNPGRPDWDKVFMELNEQNHGQVSVFYCGNPALGTTLRRQCEKYKFEFRSEKF